MNQTPVFYAQRIELLAPDEFWQSNGKLTYRGRVPKFLSRTANSHGVVVLRLKSPPVSKPVLIQKDTCPIRGTRMGYQLHPKLLVRILRRGKRSIG